MNRNSVVLLLMAAALAGAPTIALAQQPVQEMGAAPKSDDLIKALTPGAPAAGQLQVRGLRLLNANPGGADKPAAAQTPAVALDIRFGLGSADLTDGAKQVIAQLAKAINSDQLSKYNFRVEGHTDSTGKPDANMILSQRRAEAVKAYLVSNYGVASDRLTAVGRGQEEPLDAAHPASGVNRRVQVVNLNG
ncbi:MAG TPA: OmpA family protein [Aliidongia sp.]|nr:OmpA family protein [Aliidongia sp.]